MSMGNWNPNEEKVRPGMYNRFISTALSRLKVGASGIVGMPVRADWGPIGELVDVESESDILSIFGVSGEGCTTYLLNRCLLGGTKFKPNKIIAYRIATTSANYATANIAGTMKLSAKYKGARGNNFKYSVSTNILDETKKDVKLYEGSEVLATYTVGASEIEALVKAINEADGLIVAEKLGDTALEDTATKSFEGGDSGFMGGSAEDDKKPSVGNSRSLSANNKAIVNVIVGVKNATKSFNSAETACQVAGLIAATPINKSTTYKQLEDVTDVTVMLSDTEIKNALKSGSFVLTRDMDPETYAITIKVEQGINTLTTYGENESKKLSKIKCVRTLDTIDYDTGYWASRNVVGEYDNDDDGRAALVSGIKAYLETLADAKAISYDFLSEIDSAFVSEGDTVYLNTQALSVDKIEKIFNSIHI